MEGECQSLTPRKLDTDMERIAQILAECPMEDLKARQVPYCAPLLCTSTVLTFVAGVQSADCEAVQSADCEAVQVKSALLHARKARESSQESAAVRLTGNAANTD